MGERRQEAVRYDAADLERVEVVRAEAQRQAPAGTVVTKAQILRAALGPGLEALARKLRREAEKRRP